MNTSPSLDALTAAETIAWAYGDTETVRRLNELASEVREVEDVSAAPHPLCSVCGGEVEITPRVQCRKCGFVFLA